MLAAAGNLPSELWRSRCHGGRIAVNGKHTDFPALLAEALDVMASCDNDLKSAAGQLDCTPSQLIKFLKLEPSAFRQLNERRRASGAPPLK